MRKGTLRAATLAFMLTPTIAIAQQPQIRGAGLASCGTWVSESDNRLDMTNWILGFTSSVNIDRHLKGDHRDVLNGADLPSVELWITNYCTKNPLRKIWEATLAMIMEASPR
ncbi:hypothetical protein [Sinorhizobium americanum]|uniref:hypothetical protein n=1 Tax=Sinorhizobium americanum TaxID=194963 RepID=UPI00104959C3|nr:hypothetical protein [Sinorhizobium americanum]